MDCYETPSSFESRSGLYMFINFQPKTKRRRRGNRRYGQSGLQGGFRPETFEVPRVAPLYQRVSRFDLRNAEADWGRTVRVSSIARLQTNRVIKRVRTDLVLLWVLARIRDHSWTHADSWRSVASVPEKRIAGSHAVDADDGQYSNDQHLFSYCVRGGNRRCLSARFDGADALART